MHVYIFYTYYYNISNLFAVQVPGPVESLTAITLSSTSIKVTWQPPIETYGTIEKYHLYYYPDGAVGEKSVEETGFEHTLTGLTTYTLYNFRVVAHNDKGAGESTEDAQARTYSDSKQLTFLR